MSQIRRWIRPAAYALVTWLGVWAFTAWLDAAPQPVLLALAIAVAFAVGRVSWDAQASTVPPDWSPPSQTQGRYIGIDPRFSQLARQLSDETKPEAVAARVHRDLRKIVDGLLAYRYGVRLDDDPVAARRLLGEALADYVEQAPGQRVNPVELQPLLTRIESL